jgi:anaerobic magnesium-protoporphyrin IX monomethyl ester cyclase
MLANGIHEFQAALNLHQPRFVAIYEDSFNFIVKMCLNRMREAARLMAALASASGAIVIAAGPDVTDHPDLYLLNGVDYALVGEADHTLRELIGNLSSGSDPSVAHVAGLAMLDHEAPPAIRFTQRRIPERVPDVFNQPAWDLVDTEKYREAWQQAHGYFSINMVSTRGCPYHCNWCAKPIWGQHYAIRSPEMVADEMLLIKRTIRPDHIWFADDIFGLRPQWVTGFADEVASRDASIPFTIQSRADRITEEAASALARAGCVEVWLGAESGSQKILDAMDKSCKVEDILAARARLKAVGVRACFFIQFGYPGETFEDIMATVRMVREALPDDIGISVSYPLPGTRFFDMVSATLGAKTNWSDSGDLAMMFRGTYQSPFYRHLHGLLHRDLALRQRLNALSGPPDTELLAELDCLNTDWLELGRLEAPHRNEEPTRIMTTEMRPTVSELLASVAD